MSTTILPSTITASATRANIYKILDEVDKKSRRFKIMHRGKVRAVVISAEEVDAWEETAEILSNKKLMRQIRQAEKDRKTGSVHSLEDIEKELHLT